MCARWRNCCASSRRVSARCRCTCPTIRCTRARLPGVETDEIVRFLQVVNRARMLPADASDDLLTLLWEQEFVLISYLFVEALGDGLEFLQESPTREPAPAASDPRAEIAEAGAAADPAAAG